MIADLFIKKEASVDQLIQIYDALHEGFRLEDISILCCGSVLTITMISNYYISDAEIRDLLSGEAAGWIVRSIERRQ
jgi:hypothetical protein